LSCGGHVGVTGMNSWRNSCSICGFIKRSGKFALVAHQKEHFRGIWAIFLVATLSPKRFVLVHKNSPTSCQQRHHSVEPREYRQV